jgi:iron complex transport system substrate-binding protein
MFWKHLGAWLAALIFWMGSPLAAANDPAMRTLTDSVGRRMQVPVNPQRVVALAPSITEIVFALGRQQRLVGVTRYSDYPPEAARLPKVGSYVQLDAERILALSPDLCIGIKDGNPIAVVEQMQGLGIPVFAIDPQNLKGVMGSVHAIGALLDATDKAHVLADGMRERIEQVRSRVAQTQSRPRVFFQIGVSPIVSVGSDTFIDELITLAGGANVAAGSNPYPRFSREQVIALAPEVLVITSMARQEVFDRIKSEWMQWPALPAVQRRAVHVVSSNLFDRPTPRLVNGLELLARCIHPELFAEQP